MIGSYSEGLGQWIVLEDLNAKYSLRKHDISIDEVKVCLKWLANFHVRFLNKKNYRLLSVGTYWQLDMRPEEFEKIEFQELKAKAAEIDKV